MQNDQSKEKIIKKILIAIGSEKGSTLEIGNRMKSVLNSKSFAVDCLPAPLQKIDIDNYDFVIIGSGIYGGVPHKNVKQFIDSNRTVLLNKPVAVFVVCGKRAANSEKLKNQSFCYIDCVSYGLTPVLSTVFAGKIPSYSIANVILRLAIGAWPGDHRSWRIIGNWTDSLAERINSPILKQPDNR